MDFHYFYSDEIKLEIKLEMKLVLYIFLDSYEVWMHLCRRQFEAWTHPPQRSQNIDAASTPKPEVNNLLL